MDNTESIQNAPRDPPLRQTQLPEFPMSQNGIAAPSTPRHKRKPSGDANHDENKKFCENGDAKDIISQLLAMHSMFTEFKSDVITRLSTIEEDMQIIKANTLLSAEPINNVEQIDSLTTAVNEIRDKIQNCQFSSQDNRAMQGSQSVRFNPPTLDSNGDYKRKLDLNKRKSAYYNYISAEDRFEILQAQSSEEPPSVPAKYLPPFMENEHAEDLVVRKEFYTAKINCDLKSLKNKSMRFKRELDGIDNQVNEEITEDVSLSAEEKEWQLREWEQKVQEEEEKSKELWRKKHENIVSTPENQKASGKIISIDGNLFASSGKRNKANKPSAVEEGDDQHVQQNNGSTAANSHNSNGPTEQRTSSRGRDGQQRRDNNSRRDTARNTQQNQNGQNQATNANDQQNPFLARGGHYPRGRKKHQAGRKFHRNGYQRDATPQYGPNRRSYYNSNRNW